MKAIILSVLFMFSISANAQDMLMDFAEDVVRGEVQQQTQKMVHNDVLTYKLGNGKVSNKSANEMKAMAECQREQASKAAGKPVTSFNGSKYYEVCKKILKRKY